MSGPLPAPPAVDWTALRRRMGSLQGREYWRSLEELADSPDFRRSLEKEFPRPMASLHGTLDRREFVTLMGAALALAGFSGCGKPPSEKIVPYVRQPEVLVPGKPLVYATAMPHPGGAMGLLVRSDMGRPTKVEGNPRHPASLGATDVFAQASVYGLWDPDRSQAVTQGGVPSTWDLFQGELQAALAGPRGKGGEGLAILTEECLSPTAAGQFGRILGALPEARWYSHEPMSRDLVGAATRRAFREDLEPIYRFDQADVVVSLDADFLSAGPGCVRYLRDFARRRRSTEPAAGLQRLYVAESTPSQTGTVADHRFPVRSCDIEDLARRLASSLGVPVDSPGDGKAPGWLSAVAEDLRGKPGRSLVLAGRDQPASVQALVALLNHKLGNAGKTVFYIDPVPFRSLHGSDGLEDLAASLSAGRVKVLLLLGGNPVYNAPVDLELGRLLATAPFRAHLGLYADETSRLCPWHIPQTHFLEDWSDALAYDGTASIVQPLIAPLYDGKSLHDLLSLVAQETGRRAYDLVRAQWRKAAGEQDFEDFWSTALHEGVLPGTARKPRVVDPDPGAARACEAGPERPQSLELVFRPDPSVGDGRFANNAWLQELPKPLSSLTWDNAALLSPAMAARLQVANGDLVELTWRRRRVIAPVWIAPGHADHSVTVSLGYGRTRAGRVGSGLGYNAYLLRPRETPLFGTGLEIRKTGDRVRLATTQLHHSLEGRDIVRVTTVGELARAPSHPKEEAHPTLYADIPRVDHAWGMVIDLNTCTQCNSCVLACQVENNVPVVGKSQVLEGREMHWLRVDTYFDGPPENPRMHPQPVPCMHCENAPCELVCPVNATSHSREGLNQMTYNRCVGTRYCSNNCPYKVRHFNFFQYADYETPSAQERYNPDVTVRERGVMEKCTYCVQRITRGRIAAEKEGRKIRDGEVLTACQQVCPSGAIVFGDLSDPKSQVSRQRANPLDYEMLGELGTRPRTTYLTKVLNPNPRIEGV